MCFAGHIVIGGLYVCLMETGFLEFTGQCEEIQSSPREGEEVSCSSPKQREKS